jgi:hypothetical protein
MHITGGCRVCNKGADNSDMLCHAEHKWSRVWLRLQGSPSCTAAAQPVCFEQEFHMHLLCTCAAWVLAQVSKPAPVSAAVVNQR